MFRHILAWIFTSRFAEFLILISGGLFMVILWRAYFRGRGSK